MCNGDLRSLDGGHFSPGLQQPVTWNFQKACTKNPRKPEIFRHVWTRNLRKARMFSMLALETIENMGVYRTDCRGDPGHHGISKNAERERAVLKTLDSVCSERHWAQTLNMRHVHSKNHWTIILSVSFPLLSCMGGHFGLLLSFNFFGLIGWWCRFFERLSAACLTTLPWQ